MQYNSLDDQVLGGEEEEEEEEEEVGQQAAVSEEEEELNGIYFKTLVARHPKIGPSLEKLKEQFEQDNKEGNRFIWAHTRSRPCVYTYLFEN